MSWRDRLQPGRFRDAAFFIESDDAAIGRRTVLHEYPLRDVPYVEDLGRRAREFSIECFVLGPDYMTARDALIAALEAPGPGTLVHPYLGTMRVAVLSARKRESTAEGGVARFSITFAEAGENLEPRAAPDTGAIVQGRAERATGAIKKVFDEVFSVEKKPQYVTDAAIGVVNDALKAIDGLGKQFPGLPVELTRFTDDIARVTGALATLVRLPASLSASLLSLIAGYAGVATSPLDALKGLRKLFDYGATAPAVPATTPSRLAQRANQEAVIALTRRAALVEAVRASAAIDFASYQDAAAVRDELADRLDAQMETADDEVYDVLLDLRGAMVEDINARGATLARVIDVTPRTTLPALVLAHQLYGDAAREAEIVARNRIRHPGFVPGGRPLEVLANA